MLKEKVCAIVSLKCAQIGHKRVHDFTLAGNEDGRIKANELVLFFRGFLPFRVRKVNPS